MEPLPSKEKRLYGRYLMAGSNFLAAILVLGYIGHWIDQKLDKDQTYLTLGCVLGIGWGMYEALKLTLSKKEPASKGMHNK